MGEEWPQNMFVLFLIGMIQHLTEKNYYCKTFKTYGWRIRMA